MDNPRMGHEECSTSLLMPNPGRVELRLGFNLDAHTFLDSILEEFYPVEDE